MTTAAPALNLKELKIVPLPTETALLKFKSGEEEVDRNISKCGEWHTRHRSRTFVAYRPGEAEPYGFYCLGLHAHDSKFVGNIFQRTSDDARNFVPFIYINLLAVREDWHRHKIGTLLLLNAIERCALVLRNIGAYGIALNALNDRAAALYDRYGFRTNDPSHRTPLMVLPAKSALDLFPG